MTADDDDVEIDDWHYCFGGCGAKHFDHNETQRCPECGHYCPGT